MACREKQKFCFHTERQWKFSVGFKMSVTWTQLKNCSPEVFVDVKGMFKVWPGLTPVATKPTQPLTFSCL